MELLVVEALGLNAYGNPFLDILQFEFAVGFRAHQSVAGAGDDSVGHRLQLIVQNHAAHRVGFRGLGKCHSGAERSAAKYVF